MKNEPLMKGKLILLWIL